jgi:hypothetical protein
MKARERERERQRERVSLLERPSAAQGEGEEGGRRWRRQGVGEGGGWGIQGVRGGEVLLDFVGDKLSGDEGGWVFCL